ncbi:MAG: cadherin-like domain-containing protein, partial [Planctomycetes bacterium]|nr:cadherin-like domain-containing protein [Planctomycetota bacterium]
MSDPGLGFGLSPKLEILVRKATGGNVADGDVFSVRDQDHTVLFEFSDGGPLSNPSANPVAFQPFNTALEIATSIKAAIEGAVAAGLLSDLSPTLDDLSDPNFILIDLAAGVNHALDTSASGLFQSQAVDDEQTFLVSDGSNMVLFEFDTPDSPGLVAGTVAVNVTPAYSANEVANAIVLAIQGKIDDSTLSPAPAFDVKNLGQGSIQVGGPGSLNSSGTPRLSHFGSPGGILDGQSFHLVDGNQILRFEFDSNDQATAGHIPVRYSVDSTASDIAEAMVEAIRGTAFQISTAHLGNGEIVMDGDDEDGIRFDRVFTPGSVVPITVTASGRGYLDGWVDFNADGDWEDQFEQVFVSTLLHEGVNHLSISVPAAAGIGTTYARFRFSSQGGLTPSGLAVDGEVEDYEIQILSNDPPIVSLPVSLQTDEDVPLPLGGIQIADPDAGLGTIDLTLSVLHGTIDIGFVPNGVISSNIIGNGTQTVTLSSTLAEINATLAAIGAVTYTNDPEHFNGGDRLTIIVNDLGNSGTGGAQRAVGTVPITVNPINDAPVIATPGTVTGLEDNDVAVTGVSISDVEIDASPVSGPMLVTLEVANGTIDVDETAGGTSVTIQGDGTSLVTLSGNLTDINAILAAATGITYRGNLDFNGDDHLVITADDLGAAGGGGAQVTAETITVQITAVNDQPMVTVPSAALVAQEDTPLNPAGIDVGDVDAGATNVTVTLTVKDRTPTGSPSGTVLLGADALSAISTAGGTVTGNGSSTVVIDAPVDVVSSVLSDPLQWTYRPPTGFGGDMNSATPA